MDARFTLKGAEEMTRKLNPRYLLGAPSHTLMANFGAVLRDLAREEAPQGVTGDLKASLDFAVDPGAIAEWVRVGSNLDYAEPVHKGSRPHMPPVAAITPWALSKGIPPWALARSIARKGTKANPFLRRATDQARGRVDYLLSRMTVAIEGRWGRG